MRQRLSEVNSRIIFLEQFKKFSNQSRLHTNIQQHMLSFLIASWELMPEDRKTMAMLLNANITALLQTYCSRHKISTSSIHLPEIATILIKPITDPSQFPDNDIFLRRLNIAIVLRHTDIFYRLTHIGPNFEHRYHVNTYLKNKHQGLNQANILWKKAEAVREQFKEEIPEFSQVDRYADKQAQATTIISGVCKLLLFVYLYQLHSKDQLSTLQTVGTAITLLLITQVIAPAAFFKFVKTKKNISDINLLPLEARNFLDKKLKEGLNALYNPQEESKFDEKFNDAKTQANPQKNRKIHFSDSHFPTTYHNTELEIKKNKKSKKTLIKEAPVTDRTDAFNPAISDSVSWEYNNITITYHPGSLENVIELWSLRPGYANHTHYVYWDGAAIQNLIADKNMYLHFREKGFDGHCVTAVNEQGYIQESSSTVKLKTLSREYGDFRLSFFKAVTVRGNNDQAKHLYVPDKFFRH